jgi:hypothetical protein
LQAACLFAQFPANGLERLFQLLLLRDLDTTTATLLTVPDSSLMGK